MQMLSVNIEYMPHTAYFINALIMKPVTQYANGIGDILYLAIELNCWSLGYVAVTLN